MRTHILSDRHGRRFLIEVGVVVLGVLIALGAEQAVQAVKWRQEVAATSEALGDELLTATYQGYERAAVNLCLRERIKALADKVGRNQSEWKGDALPVRTDYLGPVLPQVYRTPSRIWSRDAWDAALAGGTTNHMPRKRVSDYAAVYAQISDLRQLERRENEHTSSLAFLAQDQVLESRARTEAMHTLAELDRINNMIVLIAGQVATSARELGVKLDTAEARDEFTQVLKDQRRLRGRCVRDPLARLS